MKAYLLLLLLLVSLSSACGIIQPAWETPNDLGSFDNEGLWHPNDESIEATYQLPDISVGFIYDIHGNDITPSLQVEIFELPLPIPYARHWKFDAGVSHQRTYLYVGPRFTSIFEVSLGAIIGWNLEENELTYGVGISIIKF